MQRPSQRGVASSTPARPDPAWSVLVEDEPVTAASADMGAGGVAHATVVLASASVVSRVLGVVRQSLVVAVIGLGVVNDAFTTANMLPNVIYMLVAGGVLNSVLVPQLVRAARHADGGREYTDRIITLTVAGFLVVTAVCTVSAGLLVRLYASQISPDALSLAVFFALVTVPQVFFYGLYAVLGQVLNARGQFAAAGWSPALANVVSIVGLLAFLGLYDGHLSPERWTSPMVWLFAGTATASIAVQALFLVVPLRRSGFRWRPRLGVRGVGLRSTSKVAGWAFGALLLSQLGFLASSNVMWHAVRSAGPGRYVPGVAVYANALFVFMVPHGLVAVAVITALYPRISQAAQAGDSVVLRREYLRGITVPAALTLPASAALVVSALPVTALLFSSRNAAEAAATAHVLAVLAFGVVPFSIDVLNQRFFYAHDDGKTAFAEQAVLTATALTFTLGALLVPPPMAVATIGAGVVTSNLAAALFGICVIRRRLGHLDGRAGVRRLARSGICAVGAGLITWQVASHLGAVTGRADGFLTLVIAAPVFAGVFLVLARLLHVNEITTLLGLLRSRNLQTSPTAAEGGSAEPTKDREEGRARDGSGRPSGGNLVK